MQFTEKEFPGIEKMDQMEVFRVLAGFAKENNQVDSDLLVKLISKLPLQIKQYLSTLQAPTDHEITFFIAEGNDWMDWERKYVTAYFISTVQEFRETYNNIRLSISGIGVERITVDTAGELLKKLDEAK